MSLELKINEEIKKAMLGKMEAELRALRAIKSAILLAKTSGGVKAEITQEDEMKMLQKLVKTRKDSLEIYEQQNRADLAILEKQEIEVIEKFLPAQLSEQEITTAVKDVIAQLGATSVAEMGKVMGAATKALAGKADGKVIGAIVKQLLA
jgi:uncharacterized protein